MPCLADRNFLGFGLWERAPAKGADLLWRGKKNLVPPRDERLSNGSYPSRVYPSSRGSAQGQGGGRRPGHRVRIGRRFGGRALLPPDHHHPGPGYGSGGGTGGPVRRASGDRDGSGSNPRGTRRFQPAKSAAPSHRNRSMRKNRPRRPRPVDFNWFRRKPICVLFAFASGRWSIPRTCR